MKYSLISHSVAAFISVSGPQRDRAMTEGPFANRFQMLNHQPMPKSAEHLLSMSDVNRGSEPEVGDGCDDKRESAFVARGIRPLQKDLDDKLTLSVQHILNGFMTGNVPEFVLHGANAMVLGSVLEKLDHCFGKRPDQDSCALECAPSNDSEVQVDRASAERKSELQMTSQEIDEIQNSLLILLRENSVSQSLSKADLFGMRCVALIRLLKAEVAHPGVLQGGNCEGVNAQQRESIERRFASLEKRFELACPIKQQSKMVALRGGALESEVEIALESLRVLLERSEGESFPPGYCDPILKFEHALRLLGVEIRSPGLLGQGPERQDHPGYELMTQLYSELASKDPIDLIWD